MLTSLRFAYGQLDVPLDQKQDFLNSIMKCQYACKPITNINNVTPPTYLKYPNTNDLYLVQVSSQTFFKFIFLHVSCTVQTIDFYSCSKSLISSAVFSASEGMFSLLKATFNEQQDSTLQDFKNHLLNFNFYHMNFHLSQYFSSHNVDIIDTKRTFIFHNTFHRIMLT